MIARLHHVRIQRFALFALLIGLLTVPFVDTQHQGSAHTMLTHAWERARASGDYTFRTSVDQQTEWAPSLRSAGRPPRHDYLSLQGSIDQVAEQMDLTMWRSRSPEPTNAVEIRLDRGTAQGRVGTGAWQPIDLDTMNFAPGGDPLGFLAGASNVQVGGAETRTVGVVTRAYETYTFTLDGQTFARYLEQKVVPHLRASGKLPAWMTVDLVSQYGNLHGSGKLWVSDDGLPARLQLDMQLPRSQQNEAARATVTTDYGDFNRQQLARATTPFFNNPGVWLGYRMSQWREAMPSVRNSMGGFLAVLIVAALLILSFPVWHTRRFHAGIVTVVIVSMLTSPLLHANTAVAFAATQQAAQTEQAETAADLQTREAATASLLQPTMSPHESPVANVTQAAAAQSSASMTAATTDTTSSTDTDNDGLTDTEEAEWGSCSSTSSTSADCTGVASSKDSDADGISDGIEVHTLGIDPAAADSDSDGINDNLEVNGFTLNGKTWYLNAGEADTNSDGLIDSSDCPVWSKTSTTYNAVGTCPDTDSDGTPDVWDDDNDNDAVLDAVDLSPSVNGGTHNDNNPLKLSITDLQANKPVFVDLQFRPTDARQLSYITSMLDWPTDDKGQIQRHLDTTFASTANSALNSSDSNAGYGDVRVVPMLEITMPGTSGHFANLPVLDKYKGGTRTAGAAVDTWLNSDKLDPYGISVRDIDTSTGKLQAYVPLSVVNDDIGGGRVAYNARMLYWPSQTNAASTVDWGSAQEYRIIWMVQMLTDECVDSTADADTCTRQDTLDVIHIYRDESWTLTGLEVREDHGLDVALLYENPADDTDKTQDTALWEASWNLNNTFLRGRDCDTTTNNSCSSNGQRDVRIANIESSIHGWTGNTDPIKSRSFSYDHQGYLTQLMMTETSDLLNDVFTSYATSTNPTVLFAREETFRTLNLSGLASTSGALTFALTTANAPKIVQANMSWATYRYDNGAWANYDSDQNLDRLKLQLADQSFFTTAGSTSANAADGKLIWGQLYYSSLSAGLTSVVSMNGETTWAAATGDVPEISYAPTRPAGLTAGAAFVAHEYMAILQKVNNAAIGDEWKIFSAGFKDSGLAQGIRQSFKYGAVASNMIMAATTASTVVGLGLYIGGYISGDETVQQIGEIVLGATTIAIAIVWSVNVVSTMRTAGITTVAGAFSAAGPTRAIGPVGLLIGVVAVWGMFAVQGLTSGLFNNPHSIGFNSALAYVVASTIVLLIMFVIDMIPFVGTLIVLSIMLADVLMTWFCKKTCHGGAQAWLTEVIADSLYQVNDVIKNLDSPDRLDFDITDVKFNNDEAGYTTANSATITVAVTNTLKYGGSFNDSDANRATFRYYLEKTATDHHADLALGQMRNEWETRKGSYLRTTDNVSTTIGLKNIGTGINRDFGGKLYLTESYVGPYAGCWLAFGIDTNDCDFYPYSGSSHIDLGSYVVYDILPTSLTTFLTAVWSKSTLPPTPYDPDGDGLVSMAHGGIDPDDLNWDSDGDGLSDEYELSQGFATDDSDSDNDSLTDAQEARRGLDARQADADDDGLSDQQEWTGWQIGYLDANGTRHVTWVWSDPFAADADGDSLNDLQEFYYGFHPGVATDNDAVLKTITFEESIVTETNAPQALFRMEEADGATLFADSSGRDHDTSCDDTTGTCPTGGVTGRYGSAAQFDGSNDVLATNATVTELAKGSFTLAAWIKTTSTSQAIITKSDGDNTWEKGEKSFYLDGTGLPTFVGWGNNYIRSTTKVSDGAWHHIVVTWTYSSSTSGTGKIYVDGADTTNTARTDYAANNADNTTDTLYIGLSNKQSDEAKNNFSGALDEVAIYGRAMSATDIRTEMSGRYNSNDGTVAPGDTVTYNLQINNNSASWPVKATYYGELDDSYTGYDSVAPLGEWKLDEVSGTSFADSSGHGYTATCTNCPTVGATGYTNKATQFDGVDDQLILDTAAQAWSGEGFSFGGWVYPTGGTNRYQTVFGSFNAGTGTTSSDKLDTLVYDKQSQMFFEDSAGNTGINSAPPNQWYHVMVTINPDSGVERIYLNGVLKSSNRYGKAPVTNGRFRVGGPGYTQSANTYYHFAGKIDGVVLYNRRLTQTEIVQIIAGTTTLQEPVEPSSAVYNVPVVSSTTVSENTTIPATQTGGAYLLRQVVEAALDVTDETNSGSASADPDTTLQGHYDFDDPPGDSTISDSARRLGDGSCSGTACPTMGIRGKVNRAARFDGNDLVSIAALDQLGMNYTVAAWVKARNGILVEDQKAIKPFRLWTDRYDYRKNTSSLGDMWYNSYALGYEVPSTTEWVHVAVTYNDTTNANAIYINGVLAYTPWPSCCNDYTGGAHTTKIGQLLNGYIDDVRLYSRTMTAAEVQTLYTTSAPQLQLEFEEDSTATVFQDSTSNNYDATIVGAGAGLPGRIGKGGYFDGTSSYAKITNATAINSLTNSLTIMAWIKPSDTSTIQRFISSARTASSENGIGFGIKNGKLTFNTFGVKEYISTAAPTANTWQHVAVVFDANYDAKFYLNGAYVDTIDGTKPAVANTDDPIYIGASTTSGSSVTTYLYTGMMDELVVNNRVLGDAEIERAFYNQFRWFRKQHDSYLKVDNDSPTISLHNSEYEGWGGEWDNAPVQFVVEASDASSSIWSFEYGLARHNSLDFTWQSAPRCAGTDEVLWCPTFDPRTLGGEGIYIVKFRAVDAVGNATTSGEYWFRVDGTGPTATSSYDNTWLSLTQDAQDELGWTVNLSGTVTDPRIVWSASGNTGSFPGTVDTTSVAISLIDATGEVAGKGTQYATLSNNGWSTSPWSIDYAFVGARPSGTYTVRVTAADDIGNTATVDAGTILLDARPPTTESQSATLDKEIIGSGATLSGVLTDQPDPAGAVARFHFEEFSGTTFADYSGTNNDATCTVCPARINGVFGQGLEFSRATGTKIIVPASTTLDLSTATLSTWIKPTWIAGANGYNPGILGVRDTSGATRFSWHLRDNYTAIDIYNGTSVGSVPITLTPSTWYHLAVVQEGSQWTAYLNGVSLGTVNQSFGTTSGLPLTIGGSGNGELFSGGIDEVALFDRALSAEEIYALAQSKVSGGMKVDVGLAPFDIASGSSTTSWQAATVVGSGAGLTTWNYNVPSQLEGFYQLKLRGEDAQGNIETARTIWQGALDTTAPRLTVTAQQLYGGALAVTEYRVSADDLFLDPDRLTTPCDTTGVTLQYHDNPQRVDGADVVCQVSGHVSTATITACDYADNCTTQTVTPTATTGGTSIRIDTPATSTITGLSATNVGGAAYASAGIQQITLAVDGTVVSSHNYPEKPTETTWAASWTPLNTGMHTLVATITSANGSATDVIEVTVMNNTPTATPSPTMTTTPTPTPTSTSTATITPSPIMTASPTATHITTTTPTSTATITPSPTIVTSPTPTRTPSVKVYLPLAMR